MVRAEWLWIFLNLTFYIILPNPMYFLRNFHIFYSYPKSLLVSIKIYQMIFNYASHFELFLYSCDVMIFGLCPIFYLKNLLSLYLFIVTQNSKYSNIVSSFCIVFLLKIIAMNFYYSSFYFFSMKQLLIFFFLFFMRG